MLAGGGVVGGMYEVGALAALDEALPGFRTNDFDLYVGSSAGAVVASLMANQIRPRDLFTILDEGRDDPLNFHRGAVYQKGAFSSAARNFAQLVWAVGKKAITQFRLEWPDILARSGDDMPAGFFSLVPIETYIREAFAAKGLSNSFRDCPRPFAHSVHRPRPCRARRVRGRPLRGRADLAGHRRVVCHSGLLRAVPDRRARLRRR